MSDDSEAPDFDALLRRDFRWPTAGDQPFATSDTWQNNAYIDRHGHGRLVMMMTGYKMGADLMVAQVARSRHDGDALVYPIIFNYRQFIELNLKYLIATYGHTVGVQPTWDKHELQPLWSRYLEVLAGYGHEDAEGTDAVVAGIIDEFAKVDPQSFSYRYPVDKRGRLLELGFEHVDLHRLADVMKGLEGYFSGSDGYLDNLQSAVPSDF